MGISTVLLVGIILSVYGQQRPNTLGDLWPQVKANYPGVKVRAADVAAALFNEKTVRSMGLPGMNVQTQNNYGTFMGSPGGFFQQPGLFNISGNNKSLSGASITANNLASATIDWDIFSFGKQRKENKAAHTLTGKSMNEERAYLLNLKALLSERYIRLLYSESKLDWNIRNSKRLNGIKVVTATLVRAGLRPDADSLLASSSYIQTLAENEHLKGEVNAALIKVRELYGSGSLNYKASIPAFCDPLNAFQTEIKTINPSHPALASIADLSDFFSLKSEIEKRASLPTLHILGGYLYRGSGITSIGTVSDKWIDGFSNPINNFLAGIGITWNITSLRTNYLRGQQFLNESKRARQLFTEREIDMQASLSATLEKISRQYNQIQKIMTAINQAQDAYNMYLARYKSGIITLTELLQIESLFEQVQEKQIEAARQYWLLIISESELTANFNFLFTNL